MRDNQLLKLKEKREEGEVGSQNDRKGGRSGSHREGTELGQVGRLKDKSAGRSGSHRKVREVGSHRHRL